MKSVLKTGPKIKPPKTKLPVKKTVKKKSATKKAFKKLDKMVLEKFDTKKVPLDKKIKLLFRLKKGIEKRGLIKTIALINIVVPKGVLTGTTRTKILKNEIDSIILKLVTEQIDR